ncbi:hypothetical protein PYW07_012825 [Mythimna separata]|uniref:Uncharacterized protein n=1 Tax=Mythimna separata TaxID=271217 RepID=A0AAD8DLN7_MYTSE|nr:hypothetical protein PYW07_012825 [Mythimna separata]
MDESSIENIPPYPPIKISPLVNSAHTNSSLLSTTIREKDGVDVKNANNVSDTKITGANKNSRRNSESPNIETFTDFVQEAIKLINTYNDDTFQNFIQILEKEIKKYYYKGYKYHELMENDELRKFIDEKFDLIKGKPASYIKDKVNEVAEKVTNKIDDKNANKLLDYINSMYKADDRGKFRKVLTDLKSLGSSNHVKSKNELVKKIRYGIWTIIFNHYMNLNDDEKRGLKNEIADYLEGKTKVRSPKFKAKDVTQKLTVRDQNTVIFKSKNVTNEVKKSKTPKIIEPETTLVKQTTENKRQSIVRRRATENLSETFESTHEGRSSHQLILTSESSESTHENIRPRSLISRESQEGHFSDTSTDTTSDESIRGSFSGISREQRRRFNAPVYETLYIEDFYKTTENPTVFYKSDVDRKVEEGMSVDSRDRVAATRRNSKSRQRHLTKRYLGTTPRHLKYNNLNNSRPRDLRRSIAPPLPGEQLSLEVFERMRRKREKTLAKHYSFVKNNSILKRGLKDYVKRRRNLAKKIDELKKIYEDNQRSKMNGTTYNGIEKINELKKINENNLRSKVNGTSYDVDDMKSQIDENKPQEIEDSKETAVSERQSYTHNARAQTEKNEIIEEKTEEADKKDEIIVEDTERTDKKTNVFNKDLENIIKEAAKTDDRHTLKRKKTKKVKNENTETTNTGNTDTEYKHSTNSVITQLYNFRAIKIPVFIELLTTTKKKEFSKSTTNVDNAIL